MPLDQLIMYWTNMIWWVSMRPLFHQMTETDLSFPEMIVLRNLQRGPLRVAEVASCISITQSAASRAVDRLVRDGFVDRHENPEDRRQKLLTLTRPGEVLLDTFEVIMANAVGPVLSVLTAEEHDQFRALLAKMLASQSNSCPMVDIAHGQELAGSPS
ncbi:MAG: MarR family transcriptional regulator [Chloroflexi bacterium]|jgi:DNA-binding MarR family transcriptional regulator|nr:MarR family transcriptional regulator [Chloroflexota bacterium]MDB5074592.1 MarR family transcriptional regulator [Chloroflexota bacterium]